MGWSCARAAMDSLDALKELLPKPVGPDGKTVINGSNSFAYLRHPCRAAFWETGREQADGAITGTVWRDTGDGTGRVRRAGSFRIESSGWISRFPGVRMADRIEATGRGRKRRAELNAQAVKLAGAPLTFTVE